MSNKNICVIGSGPAGVSAAKALIDRGKHVVMLDYGRQLETWRKNNLQHMARTSPQHWRQKDIETLKGNINISSKGVDEKKIFGSNFANNPVDCFPVSNSNCQFYLSFAKGGLSNLWGRGVLPLSETDLEEWPLTKTELQDSYRRIMHFMPLSGHRDRLEEIFPLYTESPQKYSLSNQNQKLLKNLNKHEKSLNKAGIYFGTTRLAAEMNACRYCGLCLYGCPYGLLYSSDQTVDQLLKTGHLTYRPGLVVHRLESHEGKVRIHAFKETGKQQVIHASRVYLAAGAIASTGIVLRSLGLYDRTVPVKCSDLYYAPAFTPWCEWGAWNENLISLSQLMLEIFDKNLSKHQISVHLHGYNDLFLDMLKNKLGPLNKLKEPFFRSILGRLYVLFCFLHSDHSSILECGLKPDGNLSVFGRENPESYKIYRKLRGKLYKKAGRTGIMLLPFYKKKRLPGTSMHFGGSFPMRTNPGSLQTDTLGRIEGLDSVHLVDASVFPTIPAGSYTLTIMANAYRIAFRS